MLSSTFAPGLGTFTGQARQSSTVGLLGRKARAAAKAAAGSSEGLVRSSEGIMLALLFFFLAGDACLSNESEQFLT
jgi:hypothetical protein